MAESGTMRDRVRRSPGAALVVSIGMMLAGVLLLPVPSALAGSGAASPASTSTTSTTLPALPTVAASITDGQTASTLLSNAIELSSVGIDRSALDSAIAVTQAKLDADASLAQTAEDQEAAADASYHADLMAADSAAQALSSDQSALKQAVLFLYTDGGQPLAISTSAGSLAVYAQDYATSALSPYGVIATHQAELGQRDQALSAAAAAKKSSDRAAARAQAALAGERTQGNRLQAELASISSASAAEVTADHLALAGQAGKELLSASSLQFTPKSAIPAPVTTTPVALTWAFAELGKSYVWGATGPDTFDCSGLTQYVWKQAGVAIPRVAADQDAWSIPVPLSQILPGDLVFFGQTDIHHVGIYIGDGLMINAPHTGDVVRVSSIWWSDLAGFGRVHYPGTPVPTHQTPTAAKPAPPVVKPTAGPVPSQTKPPKGWKPSPGSSTPFTVYPGVPPSSPTTLPASTTTTTPPTTTVPVDTTTTSVPATTTTTTVVPDSTTSTTSTTVVSGNSGN